MTCGLCEQEIAKANIIYAPPHTHTHTHENGVRRNPTVPILRNQLTTSRINRATTNTDISSKETAQKDTHAQARNAHFSLSKRRAKPFDRELIHTRGRKGRGGGGGESYIFMSVYVLAS